MAERVEIVVVGKDAASQVMRGVASSFGQLNNAVQSLVSGQSLLALTEQVVQFGKESVDATLQYANEVRSLSLISGESAESSSRFIQVLDDYKISAQDAMTATRAMTKEGLTPNLQTLAKLSDEYLAINDKQKQNEFIIKNLGRAGLQWVEVLNKGSDALLAQGEAIDDSLILTQKAIDDARAYEIAMDNWNDSVEGLKISIGTGLIPVMTQMTNGINASIRAEEILKEKHQPLIVGSRQWTEAMAQAKDEQEKATAAMLKNADATATLGEETEKTKEQLKAEEDAIKAVTQANQSQLDTLANLTGVLNDYKGKEADLKQEHDELLAKKNELISQGWWVESDAVQEVNQKLAENEQAQNENTNAFVLATNTRILSRAEELLAIDGLTTAEKDGLIERGIAMGIYTQEAATKMREEEQAAYNLASALASIPVEITTNIVTNHIDNYLSGASLNASNVNFRAGGGDVKAGNLYRVNETRTEYFQPSMSGTVIPLGNGGNGSGSSGINVTISPMVMAGDRSQAANILAPMIIDVIRKAKADKLI